MDRPAPSVEAVIWLMEDESRSYADAARKFGVNKSTITRAMQRRQAGTAQVCECCGQLIRQARKKEQPA